MFCPKCGKQIVDGAAFCPACGAQLGEGWEAPKPKRRSRKGVAIVAAIVCVLAVGGVIAFFVLNNSQHNEICGEWELTTENAGWFTQVIFDFDESKEVAVEVSTSSTSSASYRGTWEFLYEKDGSFCYEITFDRAHNRELVRSILGGDETPEVDMKAVIAIPADKSLTGLWEIKGSFYGSSSEPPSASEFVCSASVGDNMGVSYSFRLIDGYGEEIGTFTTQLHAATPEPGRLVFDDGASKYSANLSTPWGGQ